jgi:hypothetical protein
MSDRAVFTHWEQIFNVKKFDTSKDLHFITADDIKSITGHEPRLMAKFDSTKDVPPIMKKHGYILLPVKNGTYAIVRGNGFHELEELNKTEDYYSKVSFPLTTAYRGTSEAQLLDYSFNSGAIEEIIDKGALYPSIRGRERSREFSFKINKTKLDVKGVQIEVDSGFEGKDCIVLVEAKNNRSEDFLIRQLFYPYRNFRLVSPDKKIIPVFFTYSVDDRIFNFWVYEFTDQNDYNSIKLVGTHSYKILEREEIKLSDIKPGGLAVDTKLVPQANDLDKVIELVFKVSEGLTNYIKIARYFEFDLRQSSYYRQAAEALGLVFTENREYKLTKTGKQLVGLPAQERNIFFANIVMDFKLVRELMALLSKKGNISKADFVKVIADNSNLSGSTIPRRADSLMAWFAWIADTLNVINYDGKTFSLK